MTRPLAIDLFCGAGGASMGLHRAGFDVIGVDIKPQPRYPFEFIRGDAMSINLYAKHVRKPDFVWASPPCQRYSNLTPAAHREAHPDLIAAVRDRLVGAGIPYTIENVAGAKHQLINPIMLCGSMFGLRTQRHRYFETSFPAYDLLPPCDHSLMPLLVTTASAGSRHRRRDSDGPPKSVKNAPDAYGIDWMTHSELAEAIPPAYGEFIGRAVLAYIKGPAAPRTKTTT